MEEHTFDAQMAAHRALNPAERKADRGVPGLRGLLDEVVDRVAERSVAASVRVGKVVGCGLHEERTTR